MGKYQPFFDLPAAQFAGLVDDVSKRGVLLPIIVDEHGQVIDGHQRRRAAAEAGVECPSVTVAGLSEEEKQTLSLTLNLFRRHLSGTERSRALQQLANLGLSTRRMADILGISKSQVHRDLAEVERPETVTTSDGRSYPAQRPGIVPSGTIDEEPPPGIDEHGEIVSTAVDIETSEGEGTPDRAASSVPGDEGTVPSPSPSVPPVDPTLGYRATASRFKAQVRSSLLTLDPERVIETSDDHKAWADLAADLHAFASAIDQALAGPRLKAVK